MLDSIIKETGTMPTVTHLRETGRNDLACYISKTGGWKKWAKVMSVDLTPSDTSFGWEGEIACKKWLESLGYSAEKQDTKCHFDLLVNGVCRIDVKAANYASYGASCGWFYRMGKVITADVVICARMDEGDFYIFPWFSVPSTNLTISKSGKKHAPYRMNIQLLKDMIDTRQREKTAMLSLSIF